MFNNGRPCGAYREPCGTLDICPGDASVTAKVFAANLDSCSGTNKNIDSIVFKITHNEVTIMFNGDFEDETSSFTEVGDTLNLSWFHILDIYMFIGLIFKFPWLI